MPRFNRFVIKQGFLKEKFLLSPIYRVVLFCFFIFFGILLFTHFALADPEPQNLYFTDLRWGFNQQDQLAVEFTAKKDAKISLHSALTEDIRMPPDLIRVMRDIYYPLGNFPSQSFLSSENPSVNDTLVPENLSWQGIFEPATGLYENIFEIKAGQKYTSFIRKIVLKRPNTNDSPIFEKPYSSYYYSIQSSKADPQKIIVKQDEEDRMLTTFGPWGDITVMWPGIKTHLGRGLNENDFLTFLIVDYSSSSTPSIYQDLNHYLFGINTIQFKTPQYYNFIEQPVISFSYSNYVAHFRPNIYLTLQKRLAGTANGIEFKNNGFANCIVPIQAGIDLENNCEIMGQLENGAYRVYASFDGFINSENDLSKAVSYLDINVTITENFLTANNYLTDINWRYRDDGVLTFGFKAKTNASISLFTSLNSDVVPAPLNFFGTSDRGQISPVFVAKIDWQVGYGCCYQPQLIFPIEKDKNYEFLITHLTITPEGSNVTKTIIAEPRYGGSGCVSGIITKDTIIENLGRDFNENDYVNLLIQEYETPVDYYYGPKKINEVVDNGKYRFQPFNLPPLIFNLGQFKSDSQTIIQETQTTTENIVVFKAISNDPDNDPVKLQVELRQFNESWNENDPSGIIESDFVSSDSQAVVSRQSLVDGYYKWRARAIDNKGNKSEWQEYGQAGNVDFTVRQVPLYTQGESEYPLRLPIDEWANKKYSNGHAGCGYYIRDCGCAITSAVMLLRFHNITTSISGTDINPLTLNNWLTDNSGYSTNHNIDFTIIPKYANNPASPHRIVWEQAVDYNNASGLDNFIANDYLSNLNPVMMKVRAIGSTSGASISHYIVADGKLNNTYTIKDPGWYNTKNLNQPRVSYVYDYDNKFYGLRLYTPTTTVVINDGISLNLASPAEFLITDPQGRKLGKDPINNIEYNEIPNSSYYTESIGNPFSDTQNTTEEEKFIWIPNPLDGNYDVKVIGTGTGGYTVKSTIYDNQDNIYQQVFKGNTEPNLSIGYNLGYNSQQPENIAVAPQDTEPPVISHTPLNNQYILNTVPLAFNFSAQDGGVGVFSVTATSDGGYPLSDGAIISFNQIGEHTIIIIAEDYTSNKATSSITYKVIYGFSGFLPPLKVDGSGAYKMGRTLPVKFQLTDAAGNFISNALAHLFVAKISDNIVGTEEIPISTSAADTGNQFRYDSQNNQYIYNLDTSIFAEGIWQLRADLGDAVTNTILISIRK